MASNAAKTVLGLLAVTANLFASAEDTPSPNEPIPKPECDSDIDISIRYSGTTKRLYLESSDGETRGGCVTLGQIFEARAGKAPLYAVDPETGFVSDTATGTWLLSEELYVEDGITLKVYGTEAGGDADELRLLSTSETFINLRAHGGNLDFIGTKVLSWDTTTNSPDEDETDGRSYISAISEVVTDPDETCAGMAKNTMGEARMDIESSEIGYLGFQDSEAYGLTWKVRGFCVDKSNPEVFDHVNVYGNMYDSDIHHLRFGLYTYGHQQGDWRRNRIHDNSGYGFDPHDDSDLLTIHDNEVYNNGYHGIIASKRCNGVSIQGNEVYGGGETSAGIFLHRSSDDATVKGNYVHDNGDAGLAMLESFGADVSDNTFENNKYGVRFSVACGDNVFSNNVISNSVQYNAYSYLGSDLPETVDSGRSQNNVFSQNTIVGGQESIKIKEADGTQFLDNVFEDALVVRFDNATVNLMQGNAGLEEAQLIVTNGACFDGDSDAGYEPVC
nr:mannuronan C5-epimerase [Cladosiphon okamuranus]|eukprot:g15936.t1